MGHPGVLQHGEQVDERGVERGEDLLVAVVRRADPRPEVVRRAAAAEDQPVVGGALAVDDQVAVVAERLAPAQPDLLPDRLGQRLGGDDQGVDGHQPPPLAVEGAGVALGRTDHALGAHDPVLRRHLPGRDGGGGRLLVERDPPSYDGVGQAADQPAGVDGRAVGGVRRAADVGAGEHRRRLGGVEQPELVLAAAPPACVAHLRLGPRELGPGPGQGDGAALGHVGVDALGRGRLHHLVDAVPHRGVLGQGVGPRGACGQRLERGREERRAPATVAAARTEARGLAPRAR